MKKIFNKKYWKYRLKMQQKFDELFLNKRKDDIGDVEKMREYTTKNFFIQVMLTNVDGVKIINVEKDNEEDREAITYGFNIDNKDAIRCISDCKSGLYKGVKVDGFYELKAKRKAKINDYFNRKNK